MPHSIATYKNNQILEYVNRTVKGTVTVTLGITKDLWYKDNLIKHKVIIILLP